MSNLQAQIILKNQMMRKKQLVQNLALEGRQIEVEISELANVK